jgi:PPOX class probable F420-dependent enzyme
VKFSSLEPKVRAFLEGPRFAVLATINQSGSPQLTEMWYGIKGDELFFNTTEERQKKTNLDRDPRVSLLVSELKGQPTWRYNKYVRVDGTARLVATGAPAVDDIVALSVRYDGPETEAQARASFSKQHRATYVIDIRRVYPKGL